jgi:hypothetical protein
VLCLASLYCIGLAISEVSLVVRNQPHIISMVSLGLGNYIPVARSDHQLVIVFDLSRPFELQISVGSLLIHLMTRLGILLKPCLRCSIGRYNISSLDSWSERIMFFCLGQAIRS